MKLFAVLAGISDNDFAIGGIDFYAAPLTLAEYAEFQNVDPQDEEASLGFLADKLARRIKNKTKTKEEEITPDWVRDNLEAVMRPTVQYVLLNGEMPKKASEDGEGEKKAQP